VGEQAPELSKEIARWSALMGVGAVAIPLFGLVAAVTNASYDPAWAARLALAAVCVLVIVMGRAGPSLARWVPLMGALGATLAMGFFAVRMNVQGITATHLVAFQLLYVLPLMVMQKPSWHVVYSALAWGMAAAAYVGVASPGVPPVSAAACLVILGLGTSLLSLERGRAEAELWRARAELEERVVARTAELSEEVQQRRRAEADALRVSRAKSRFLATMSHELRTPLNAVIGYTELVREELDDRPDLVVDLGRVLSSAGHLLRMVSDVLDLSRVEAGTLGFEWQTVDVSAHLQELVRSLAPVQAEHGNELRAVVSPGMSMTTDPTRVAQIVINLVTNALKFTEDGWVEVRAAIHDDALVVEVEDNGPGIAPDDLARVFTLFEQGDGSTTRRVDGLGLGLALSQELAERLGGRLDATSHSADQPS